MVFLGGATNDYSSFTSASKKAVQTVSGNTATITIDSGVKYMITNIEAE